MQDVTVHRIMGRTPERDADGEGDAEVHRLRRSLDEARKQELRLLADFQNLRRRIAHERGTLKHEGKREALSALLPVLDAFERALKAGSSDRGFYDGMAATHGLFVEALRRLGAEPVEAEGEVFDPMVHEAVGTTTARGIRAGTVVSEVRRGWKLDDDLLRPSQVLVAAGRESDDPWP
jgi:molecular chaperone GrpE